MLARKVTWSDADEMCKKFNGKLLSGISKVDLFVLLNSLAIYNEKNPQNNSK